MGTVIHYATRVPEEEKVLKGEVNYSSYVYAKKPLSQKMAQIADNTIPHVGGALGMSAGLGPAAAAAASPRPAWAPASRPSLSESPGHTRGNTDDPKTPAVRSTRGLKARSLFPTATPEATASRGLSLPAPAGTTTPKMKPGRIGYFWTPPPELALTLTRSWACCLRLSGASTAWPLITHRSPAAAPRWLRPAGEPLTSSCLGARDRRYTVRRREGAGRN